MVTILKNRFSFFSDRSKTEYKFIDTKYDNDNNFRKIGELLSLIKNAKYVITDSFNATEFSIVFNKNFVVTGTGSRGNDRIKKSI